MSEVYIVSLTQTQIVLELANILIFYKAPYEVCSVHICLKGDRASRWLEFGSKSLYVCFCSWQLRTRWFLKLLTSLITCRQCILLLAVHHKYKQMPAAIAISNCHQSPAATSINAPQQSILTSCIFQEDEVNPANE